MRFTFGLMLALGMMAVGTGCRAIHGSDSYVDGPLSATDAECPDEGCDPNWTDGTCQGASCRPHHCGILSNLAGHGQKQCNGGGRGLPAGPNMGAVTYPYYTTRGPRDFLLDDPPSIGP